MFHYRAFDDEVEELSQMIAEKNYEHALAYYIENRENIPKRKQKLFFHCIQCGLEAEKMKRRGKITAILTFGVGLLLTPWFFDRLTDMFSFMTHSFIYYNYAIAFLTPVLSVAYIIGALQMINMWVVFPASLNARRTSLIYSIGMYAVFGAVALYSVWQFAPLARDLPMAVSGEYSTRIVTHEERMLALLGGVMQQTDRTDVREILTQQAIDDFGWDPDDTDFPESFYRRESRGIFDVHVINLGDGRSAVMRELPFRSTQFGSERIEDLPQVTIKYLPHSRTILRININ